MRGVSGSMARRGRSVDRKSSQSGERLENDSPPSRSRSRSRSAGNQIQSKCFRSDTVGKSSRSASPKNTGTGQPQSRQIRRDANLEWQAKIRKALESDKGDRLSRAEYRARVQRERERRIYVGSLGPTTTAEDIALLFATFGTVKDVIFPRRDDDGEQDRTRRYCFVEFTTKEAAEAAAATMDRFSLKGRMIRVARPATFSSNGSSSRSRAHAEGEGRREADGAPRPVMYMRRPVRTQTGLFGIAPYHQFASREEADSRSRREGSRVARVCNLPEGFYEPEIKQIFDVFGPIMDIDFNPARREALVHFFDRAHANSAVATMHGFLIGGHDLRVSLDALNGERPSMLVVLKNLVDAKDLDDEVKDEVFQECKKYGKVKEIRVHVVPQTSEVRIFALFELPEQANRAVQVFNKRSFAKRKVHCELYDVEAYKKHIFDL